MRQPPRWLVPPRPGLTAPVLAGLVLGGLCVLAGCSLLNPYATTPAAPEPGAIPGPRVAICYNTLSTDFDEVKQHAQDECAAGTTAEPVDTDWHLQSCPVLLPTRATFACTKKK